MDTRVVPTADTAAIMVRPAMADRVERRVIVRHAELRVMAARTARLVREAIRARRAADTLPAAEVDILRAVAAATPPAVAATPAAGIDKS